MIVPNLIQIKLIQLYYFKYSGSSVIFVVPGPPTNITYRIVGCHETTDYCHLNLIWLHPYRQNGTITSFNIILNSTDDHKDVQNSKNIQEVYKIENGTYYSYYTYQVITTNKQYSVVLNSLLFLDKILALQYQLRSVHPI